LQNTKMEKDSLAARTDVGKNIVVNYSEKGIRTAILTAPTMVKQEDTAFKTYFPDGIMLKLYDSAGKYQQYHDFEIWRTRSQDQSNESKR
jgi:hypothetical protein